MGKIQIIVLQVDEPGDNIETEIQNWQTEISRYDNSTVFDILYVQKNDNNDLLGPAEPSNLILILAHGNPNLLGSCSKGVGYTPKLLASKLQGLLPENEESCVFIASCQKDLDTLRNYGTSLASELNRAGRKKVTVYSTNRKLHPNEQCNLNDRNNSHFNNIFPVVSTSADSIDLRSTSKVYLRYS